MVSLCAVLLAVSACNNIRGSLGLGKQAPDEFSVVRSAPHTLPPDYSLRPPNPGAPRPTEQAIRDQAATDVFESAGAPADQDRESSGEVALLQQAGAGNSDPDIRRKIDRDFSLYVKEEDSFFEALLFWQKQDPLGDVVDAEGEARRLRENAALGDPVTTGETPTIQRREKALLEGIF
jgi:hypothetical protein